MEFYGHMFSDASAALGIVQRRGLGKLRHLDTSFLWIQEVNYKRDIDYGKVAGAEPSGHWHKASGRGYDGEAFAWYEISICRWTVRIGAGVECSF